MRFLIVYVGNLARISHIHVPFDYESMCMYSNEKNMDRTYYFIKLGYLECYQLGADTTTTRYLVDTFFHSLVWAQQGGSLWGSLIHLGSANQLYFWGCWLSAEIPHLPHVVSYPSAALPVLFSCWRLVARQEACRTS